MGVSVTVSWRRPGDLCQRGCGSWERGGVGGQGREGYEGFEEGYQGRHLLLESLMPLGLAAGVKGQRECGAGQREKRGGEEEERR